MVNQAYKVLNTHAHEITRWTTLSRTINSCATHLGGMDGDVQSDLDILTIKNGEQLEYFHSIILSLQ